MSNPETPSRLEIPPAVTKGRVEQSAREFATIFHDLKEQTFATTTWLGVPLVKTPADILVLQQIIVETRPELIVETGVYVGGSAALFASLQEALGIDGKVIAVDVDLSFVHQRVRDNPRIELLEGSSTDPGIVSHIRAAAKGRRTMVDLDADHRAHHVLEELRTYADLVTPNCYLIVEDSWFGGRPVREDAVPGPSEALDAWLAEDPPFESDRWRERYLLTQNPRGYLRRVPDDGAPPPGRERPDNFMIGAFELAGVEAGGCGRRDRPGDDRRGARGRSGRAGPRGRGAAQDGGEPRPRHAPGGGRGRCRSAPGRDHDREPAPRDQHSA